MKKNWEHMPTERKILTVILIAVALNALTFGLAFPVAFQLPKSATFARDFSAYYIGEWRLLHNPTQIYNGAIIPKDYPILPRPQTFKYTPSFLIFFAPFLTLSYPNALAVFDTLQFALIPALAFFVYKLVKDKNLVLASVASVIILVDPLPSLTILYSPNSILKITVNNLGAASFSPGYFCGYMMGNAHVLQATLLVGALYFGYTKKPWLSALLFMVGSFDPRAAILALPLLIWYNRHSIVRFVAGSTAFLAAANLPFFFYYGIGYTFLNAEVNGNIAVQMYQYDWIPIYSIAALTIIEIATQVNNRRKPSNLASPPETKNQTEPKKIFQSRLP
jgi:hypothetical protein